MMLCSIGHVLSQAAWLTAFIHSSIHSLSTVHYGIRIIQHRQISDMIWTN